MASVTYLSDLRLDVGYALRLLRRAPGFTAVAVVTLALGIGATTSMFTIVDAVLLQPLSFPESHRLVMVRPSSGSRLSAAYLHDWRLAARAFRDMAGWHDAPVTLTGGGAPAEILAGRVTPNFFSMLGSPPIVGRTLTYEPALTRAEPEVVLSHGLWQRRFGGDSSVIGRAITLDGETFTVVGVMPELFAIRTTELSESRAELWIPQRLVPGDRTGMGGMLHVVGRLAPGASREQAQAELAAIAKRLETEYPSYSRDWRVEVIPLLEATVMDVRMALLVLFAAVGILLLIACVNVAHLVMSRATRRHTELAVRLALGAARSRLLRQFATEGLVLAIAGGVLGVVVAVWGTPVLLSMVPAGFDVPRIREIHVDLRVLAFATAVTAITALVAGVAPLVGSLHGGAPHIVHLVARLSSSTPRSRVRDGLIVSEVALAFVLLVTAGLVVRSFVALNKVEPGFIADQVLTMRTTLSASKYTTDERVRRFGEELLKRIESLNGVLAAGTVGYLPLSGTGAAARFQIEGRPESGIDDQKFSWTTVVGGRYFEATGIPLRRGRFPDARDREATLPVFVIDEELARRFWPNQDPLGARLTWDGPDDEPVTGEIIGVVGSVHWRGLAAPPEPTTYFWFPQVPGRELTVVVRTAGNPVTATAPVMATIKDIDPDQAVADVRLLRELIAEDLAQPRFTMLLLGGFAVAALVLATIGLYGIISFATAQRTREIGIRIALGAQRDDVLRLVLQRSWQMTAGGILLGGAAALAFGRMMAGLLYGVAATDPVTLLIVGALVGVIAMFAAYIPARRATRIEPAAALAE